MSNTQLECALAEALEKATGVNIPAIVAAAQACCIGGCAPTVAEGKVEVVVTPAPTVTKKAAAAVRAAIKEVEKPIETPVTKPPETEGVKYETIATGTPLVEKPTPVAPVVSKEPPAGIDLSGLFVGTGADKKVVKDVFLAAVEKAKNVATLAALNATCDCGFATGDYTDNEMEVLRRKLKRWGAAQE